MRRLADLDHCVVQQGQLQFPFGSKVLVQGRRLYPKFVGHPAHSQGLPATFVEDAPSGGNDLGHTRRAPFVPNGSWQLAGQQPSPGRRPA